MMEQLYEVSENTTVQFWGYASEKARYDFAIVYTQHFFGKPMVVCMQTGQSCLLGPDEAEDAEYLMKAYRIHSKDEAEELSQFLQARIPAMAHEDQY